MHAWARALIHIHTLFTRTRTHVYIDIYTFTHTFMHAYTHIHSRHTYIHTYIQNTRPPHSKTDAFTACFSGGGGVQAENVWRLALRTVDLHRLPKCVFVVVWRAPMCRCSMDYSSDGRVLWGSHRTREPHPPWSGLCNLWRTRGYSWCQNSESIRWMGSSGFPPCMTTG